MVIDKRYCSSSFLMYRTLKTVDGIERCFNSKLTPRLWVDRLNKQQIWNSMDLLDYFKKRFAQICADKKIALALSGGIDSAILAKFMPEGSTAYTFKCVVPGVNVIDETEQAAKYAEECHLNHKIIEVYWEDFEKYAPILMKHKGAPIHSIEVQIYKAGLQALADKHDAIIYGESCDLNYGGLSGLLSRDWTLNEFIDRYSYVRPDAALKDYEIIASPIEKYMVNGYVDVHEFDRNFFMAEAMGSYSNACELAGIELLTPYAETYYADAIDLARIRRGENKYVIREVFSELYKGWSIPTKTPMPRPMNEWLAEWEGPRSSEFCENCIENMSGDQRWMIWALEKFYDILDEGV